LHIVDERSKIRDTVPYDDTLEESAVALFLSLHQAPGLSPEEIAGYGPDVAKSVYASFRQLYVNTDTGFIVSVYEADSAAAVEQEFERVGFPFDSINEIDYTLNSAQLAEMLARG
jgi:Protein of unknown function (DUF4242)